jgi:hypothetical protein
MRFLSRFGLAALVGFLASALIALASYSLGLWLGRNSDNLRWIIYASFPFALLIGLTVGVLPRRKVEQHGGTVVDVLLGASLGSLYALIADGYALGGPAILVLMLSCWVPAGISAMLATTPHHKQRWAIMGPTIFCLAAIILPEPIFNAATHNQQLTVAIITPAEMSTAQLVASPETLGFHKVDEIRTAKNDVLERVRALGYTQTFRVLSITREGKGRKSLAVIVVSAPITMKVVLPEPDDSTVVYFQQSENWEKNPAQTPVLNRGITLMPPGNSDRSLGYFEIPDAQGVSLEGWIGAANQN